jgi:NDP-sugar pyrophosphorylase family protein
VKVINCVLMDNISIADGSHIQNSIICSGAIVQERCSLKDCQVGDVAVEVVVALDLLRFCGLLIPGVHATVVARMHLQCLPVVR